MPKDPKSSVIPVRLSEAVVKRLDSVAEMIGTTRTALIRLCADTFAGHIEKGGKAALPLNWSDILEAHDGRTLRSKQRIDPSITRMNVTLNEETAAADSLPSPQRVVYPKKQARKTAKEKP